MPPVTASLIIVNWNGAAHLPGCLDSLARQTFPDFETILVDNGSSDGSLALVAGRYPWVKTVALPANVGFAAGNNAGYRRASGEFIVTLNNDTEAEPTWLAELVRAAGQDPAIGMVASRVCSFADRGVIDSLGVTVCRDGMSRGASRLLRFSDQGLGKTEEVLMPSACAALYRRRMIEAVGFFDEDFFAYCEDTDLGLRGRLAGWRAVLARDAAVYHKYSQTGGALSPQKLYLVERNHYWVALKTFPLRDILLLPAATALRYLAQVRAVAAARGTGRQFARSASGAHVAALLRAVIDAAAGFPMMWKKRRAIAATRRIGDREFARLLRRYRMSFRELLDAR